MGLLKSLRPTQSAYWELVVYTSILLCIMLVICIVDDNIPELYANFIIYSFPIIILVNYASYNILAQ
jgi:hypothetical protein